jgi:hypothetical protein
MLSPLIDKMILSPPPTNRDQSGLLPGLRVGSSIVESTSAGSSVSQCSVDTIIHSIDGEALCEAALRVEYLVAFDHGSSPLIVSR